MLQLGIAYLIFSVDQLSLIKYSFWNNYILRRNLELKLQSGLHPLDLLNWQNACAFRYNIIIILFNHDWILAIN